MEIYQVLSIIKDILYHICMEMHTKTADKEIKHNMKKDQFDQEMQYHFTFVVV